MLVQRHLPNGLVIVQLYTIQSECYHQQTKWCSIQASGTEYGYPSLTPPRRQSHVLDYADRGGGGSGPRTLAMFNCQLHAEISIAP